MYHVGNVAFDALYGILNMLGLVAYDVGVVL
jgi:hypothetical protein